jgi:hypothetical protein
MNEPAGRASYAYAVARSFDPAQLAGVRGVDGAEVRLVRYRDLVAVVSPVPLTEFDEAALRTKLEWLPWLEATARAHHAVVDVVATSSVTLPLRLATVYRRDERVIEVLRQGYRRFRAALDRLAGRVELGVKVYTDPQAMALAASPLASSPGRDYLRRRRAQHRARRRLAAGGGNRRAGGRDPGGARRRQPPAPAAASKALRGAWRERPQRCLPGRRGTHRGVRRLGQGSRRGSARHPHRAHRSMGALLLRAARRRGARVNGNREVALVDLLDRLVAGGIVLTGDLTLAIADIDLVRVSLRALITSIDTGEDR